MRNRSRLLSGLARGVAAGAAGTTALNAVTYLDMALRGRPSSSAPQQTVEQAANEIGVDIPGDDEVRQNRLSGLGPLTGIAAGIGTGALIGLARALGLRPPRGVTAVGAGALAMLLADAPISVLGVSHPTEWSVKDWAADAIPHLGYGAVAALVLHGFERTA